jgi:hypothetical protein
MAKEKKRVAARKQSSKRGKASAKVSAKAARKIAAKRATVKKAKSKVRRAGTSARKSAASKRREPEMARPVEMLVETTIIDVIGEPDGGLIAATEYHSLQAETSISACDDPSNAEVSIGTADIPTIASDQGVPEHEAEDQRGTWSE